MRQSSRISAFDTNHSIILFLQNMRNHYLMKGPAIFPGSRPICQLIDSLAVCKSKKNSPYESLLLYM